MTILSIFKNLMELLLNHTGFARGYGYRLPNFMLSLKTHNVIG